MENISAFKKYEVLGVPQKIMFKSEVYSFKKELTNNFLSYRCVHRQCKASLKLSTETAKQIESKINENSKIDATLIGIHENHPQEQSIEENLDKIKNEKEMKDLAKALIKKNLELPLSFHIKNLDTNKLKFSNVKIKNMLQTLREENFPKDKEYLQSIELIRLDIGDSEEMKNIIFCPAKEVYFNPQKNKFERLVFFTTFFQLKIMAECEEIFIDATFKMAPKNFYQILNVWGYAAAKNLYLPLMHILMTAKNKISYTHAFLKVKELFSDYNIVFDFSNKIITTDYEKSLRSAINEIFKPKFLQGCFFHYSKSLWKKARDYGLTKKKFRKESMILIFCFKIFPYVHDNNREEYIKKIKEFIKDKDKAYMK